MLAQKYRFHGHGSLRYLYRNNKTARTRHFLLRYTTNKHRNHARITIIVGKKVYKSAARRNRIRRRLYEIIRLDWLDKLNGYDLAVTVYSPEVLLLPHDQLVSELRQLLSQVPSHDVTP